MIFTLATPHVEPVVSLTYSLQQFYQKLNLFWSNSTMLAEKNMTLVSIASGTRDTVLDSRLTHVDHLISSNHSFTVYTTGIPGCWSSSDHEGMIWCEQLLRSLSTAIYRTSFPRPLEVSSRMSVLRNIFLPQDALNVKGIVV